MTWLKNTWYQAGWADEVEAGQLLARTFLNTPVVIFRDAAGQLKALRDRCPHRFAPLSAGKITDGIVTCGYHGLSFDSDGKCAHNPHGKIASSMQVDAYPMVERHTAMWIWLGDPEQADPALITDLGFIDETPSSAQIRGYMPTRANYELITDNILDLSHADYLHPTTLGGMMTESVTEFEDRGDRELFISWAAKDCPPPGAFQYQIVPPQTGDFWIDVQWQPPALMKLRVLVCVHGETADENARGSTLHNMVPETETSTHYFYCSTRRTEVDNPHVTKVLKAALEQAFIEEDKPMLEKQQQAMAGEDFWDLKPRLLGIDQASVAARRKLAALIKAEQA